MMLIGVSVWLGRVGWSWKWIIVITFRAVCTICRVIRQTFHIGWRLGLWNW